MEFVKRVPILIGLRLDNYRVKVAQAGIRKFNIVVTAFSNIFNSLGFRRFW